MSSLHNIFGLDDLQASDTRGYRGLGLPRNPFKHVTEAGFVGAPFYTGHIKKELSEVQRWVVGALEESGQRTLSLIGTIGTGKTRIIHEVHHAVLKSASAEQRVAAYSTPLTAAGYGRGSSVGALLVQALERVDLAWITAPSIDDAEVLPLVHAIIEEGHRREISLPQEDNAHPVERALLRAALKDRDAQRIQQARHISQWLMRTPLTQVQARETGLSRRVDWEGELILVVCALLRLAKRMGVLHQLFLFIDQLEDLFGRAFSDLRRARLLTDLRGLVDEIDAGTPIGLLLAWSPELQAASARQSRRGEVAERFQQKYEALYTRMRRREVSLPLLGREHAEPFAREWIRALEDEQGYDEDKQPDWSSLVNRAWEHLDQEDRLFPSQETTPRELLAGLEREVEAALTRA